jgi:hypothetical protein
MPAGSGCSVAGERRWERSRSSRSAVGARSAALGSGASAAAPFESADVGRWSRALFGVLGLRAPARSGVERRSLPRSGGGSGSRTLGSEDGVPALVDDATKLLHEASDITTQGQPARWPVRKEGVMPGKSWMRSAAPHGRSAGPSARGDVCRSRSLRIARGAEGAARRAAGGERGRNRRRRAAPGPQQGVGTAPLGPGALRSQRRWLARRSLAGALGSAPDRSERSLPWGSAALARERRWRCAPLWGERRSALALLGGPGLEASLSEHCGAALAGEERRWERCPER